MRKYRFEAMCFVGAVIGWLAATVIVEIMRAVDL